MKTMNVFIIDIKLILKQVLLHNKFLFKNPINLFFLSFILVMSVSIVSAFIPIMFGMPIVMQISTVLPLGIIYASISYKWRESTLYGNLLQSKNTKVLFNASILITMMFLTSITTFSVLFLIFILNSFGFILSSWVGMGELEKFTLLGGWYEWGILFYTQFTNVILLFSIFFLFQSIAKTLKSFYIMMFILSILLLLFGGSLNSFFSATTTIATPSNEYYLVPSFEKSLFPDIFYIPSLLLPLYANGEILRVSIAKGFSGTSESNMSAWVWLNPNIMPDAWWRGTDSLWVGVWTWNILWIMPWLQMIFFILISYIIRKSMVRNL